MPSVVADRREHILDVAVALLEKEGPRAFRQTRIAREAGVEQGHLTYYFPRKADLEAAVLARIAEKQREGAAAFVMAAGAEDPRARVLEVIKMLVRDHRRTRLLLSFLLASDDEAAVRKQVEKNLATQRHALAALFGREEEDPHVELALATIRGLAFDQVLAPKTQRRVDELVDAIAGLFGMRV